jgi:hypothetical protein
VAREQAGSTSFLFDLPTAPDMLSRARGVAAKDSAQYGATFAGAPFGQRVWKLGVFEAHEGRVSLVAEMAGDLHRRALNPDSTHLGELAQSLDALAQIARGTHADSLAAERTLFALLALAAPGDKTMWDESRPKGIERLALARLLAARGAHQDAIDIANIFDSPGPLTYLQFLPASLELRARAAKALGNSVDEAHYLARLTALRAEAKATGG